MSISRRLFGGRGWQSDPKRLQQTVFAFIEAETWSESRRIIEEHPELLSDEADRVLEQLVAMAREEDDEYNEGIFAAHRELLRRCRAEGLDGAFAELAQPSQPDAEVPVEFLGEMVRLMDLRAQAQRDPGMHRQCVALLEDILRRLAPGQHSAFRAALLTDLGIAYRNLPTGNRAANLWRAIRCYEEALRFYTPEVAPLHYARTQHNLGNAYVDLPTGDRGANLQRAITCFEEARRFGLPNSGAAR